MKSHKNRLGLALGSGSARAWSHIGIIRAFQDEGITISTVTGTSMGALIGGAFAAGFLDRLEQWARNLTWLDILRFLDVTLPRAGLIEGDRLTNYFRSQMTDIYIEELPIPFAAVAAELDTGREIWLRKGSLFDAIRASMSMPGLLTPFRYEDKWLVDGGLVNPVPVNLCRELGANIVVAVNLNSDIMGRRFLNRCKSDDAGKTLKSRFPKRLATIINGKINPRQISMFRRFLQDQPRRGPSIVQVIAKSVYIMQDRITKQRLMVDQPDIVISPHLAHIGLLEFHMAEECIEEGYRAAMLSMPLLKDIID